MFGDASPDLTAEPGAGCPPAEDVVQDSFIAMHLTCPRLDDGAKVLPYLRQCVVNRSRSALRHRAVTDQHRPAAAPDMPGAEDSALDRLARSAVISALGVLAPRQRQVLALKYFAGMSEAQVAAVLGISKGTVKTHASRALTRCDRSSARRIRLVAAERRVGARSSSSSPSLTVIWRWRLPTITRLNHV